MKSLSAPARRPTPLLRSDMPRSVPARRASGTGSVLGAILDHGPVARSTVARLTGLSPASVTGHVGQLLARGLVRERRRPPAPGGSAGPTSPSRSTPAGTWWPGRTSPLPTPPSP
ncbi:MarR family transcriptional regulator [Streptomyces sp. NPDC056352]|uniref:MarR family transcriptional regulator n=1 Tax=Streptomyces sp. NPDC056352 TaxID=3345791 RepID=UPI0035DF640E